MFDFMRVTVFCLGNRLSKHKITRYVKNLGVMAPWLRLCFMGLWSWRSDCSEARQVEKPRCPNWTFLILLVLVLIKQTALPQLWSKGRRITTFWSCFHVHRYFYVSTQSSFLHVWHNSDDGCCFETIGHVTRSDVISTQSRPQSLGDRSSAYRSKRGVNARRSNIDMNR